VDGSARDIIGVLIYCDSVCMFCVYLGMCLGGQHYVFPRVFACACVGVCTWVCVTEEGFWV
jgi:hypothetical protein